MKTKILFVYLFLMPSLIMAGVIYTLIVTKNFPSHNTDPIPPTTTPTKLENTITLEVDDKVYDGKEIEINISSISEESPILIYRLADDNSTLTEAPKNAGNYSVTAIIPENDEYNQAEKTAHFTILQREVTLKWESPLDLIYNGNEKTPNVSISTGLIDDDECEVTAELSPNNNNINAGSFTFNATELTNPNYKLPDITTSPTYTIEKATYDMSMARWDYTSPIGFNGANKSVYVTGLPSGVTVKSYSNNVKQYVGTYTASVVLDYDTNNYYKPILPDLVWKITIDSSFEVKVTQTSTNYINDKLSQVVVACNDPTGTLEWIDGTQVLTQTLGYFTIKYTAADNSRIENIEVAVTAQEVDDTILDYYYADGMMFTLNHTNQTASVKANDDTITKAIIPDKIYCNRTYYTVTRIESKGFYNIDTLVEVYIPETISNYGGTVFAHCDNLTTATLDEDLTELGIQTFMYCPKLTNVTLPKNITKITTGLFYNCSSITEMTIPSSVKIMESSCFYGTSIQELILPNGLTTIGNHALRSNEFTSITIPASVISIGESAFANNSLLTTINILSENITLGLKCFSACYKLKTIYLSSSTLVNNIESDTSDTSMLLSNLSNNDILYISDKITNITSTYINSMFTKVESLAAGYNAYQFSKYYINTLSNIQNRIYVKGSTLYGNETLTVTTPSGSKETLKLDMSMLEFFDTSTTGKKYARLTYNFAQTKFVYYVLNSQTDTSLNCISQTNNLLQSYYVGESLNVSKTQITYNYANDGYMISKIVNVTPDMVTGFNTSTTGSRMMTITHNDYTYQMRYHVFEPFTEKVTSSSFLGGTYYSSKTTEYTTHFTINIAKGTYLYNGYKELIEEVYTAMEEASGLKFGKKIILDVNDTNYPSCGGNTLHITSNCLFGTASTTFIHELSHALDHTQTSNSKSLPNAVLTEGFATYIEYLTTKKLFDTNPKAYSHCGAYNSVIENYSVLDVYLYDVEDRLLRLERDEIFGNSQYQVGGRIFAYLHHRYGDFCSWLVGDTYRTNSIDTWIAQMKTYYNNENLFDEFITYSQSFGDKYYSFLGANEVNDNTTYSEDFTLINKYNYYFDFTTSEAYMGYQSFYYKDLYINIDSARDQLTKKNVAFSELSLRTGSNTTIELYNSSGNLLTTVTSTKTAFSLAGVSFIKLVGVNEISTYLTYT